MTNHDATARELAVDIVAQWFRRSCGDLDRWMCWKRTWEDQLTDQFQKALATVERETKEGCEKRVASALGDWITDVPEGEDLNAVIHDAIFKEQL